ncbi:MAG: hypothetical protein UY50_C0011G0009 [Parcubacteria group bacterium GW2011_GWA2_49_9]|nr:MAG: hypothetical protein UY50_C0011G0009 [Parcubacteria group bacterium GW2011_GWA2_49_9]
MKTKTLPSFAEVQQAFAEITGYPVTKFTPSFKLLDCAGEIERVEQMFGVRISVRNFINASVQEVFDGMSFPS